MKVWIAVEGGSDSAVVQALLPRELKAMSSIVVVGGRSNISSVARTLLVNHREPLALVADADSLEPEVIRDRSITLTQELKEVAVGTQFKVILCIPVIEAIFFEAVDILERIFPKGNLSSLVMLYKLQPKEACKHLFRHGGGPKNLAELLGSLTEQDSERLRATGPIRELMTFIQEVMAASRS